ncbi:cytochrome d ubiquinol oxidase subunit II [Helicobacter sp. MIT 21-1697]|uniref:cytochrome d ubiquinol oxidase subunit II n=1 Tax=Helicobacter sp. MIT 21-1697 TaxID=2993733 RepID=UPI00224B1767|nr:cytochrome d ubiquinol oxidase subunit II [Helicobacter sp. MIT 21-1697]MCX2717702.1 cytochrome d ubiquinol oxidase subunit II [Helicobacter sp. MIT 21-1697]
MFFGLDLGALQIYWWIIISLLAGLLVFMFFVQGGQSLICVIAKDELEKTMLINSLGRKWELGFTTLVLFGGACFAAFPLFYSTSFGGAYWIWLAILLCFIIQAVSYEYRKKECNLLGSKVYEVFLWINGVFGVFLIGVAISTFFSGSHFVLDEHNFVEWSMVSRGLEALLEPANYLLGLTLVFLAQILGASYFLNNIDDERIAKRARKAILFSSIAFLPCVFGFLAWICCKDGFYIEAGKVTLQPYVYLHNFLSLPYLIIGLLIGIVLVLWGIYLNVFTQSKKGIFPLGVGSVLVVMAVFLNVGLGQSAFYPSIADLQSSLYIKNASSSYYTLSVMSYVSLLVPFVVAYIVYVWRAMDRVKITRDEMQADSHTY